MQATLSGPTIFGEDLSYVWILPWNVSDIWEFYCYFGALLCRVVVLTEVIFKLDEGE